MVVGYRFKKGAFGVKAANLPSVFIVTDNPEYRQTPLQKIGLFSRFLNRITQKRGAVLCAETQAKFPLVAKLARRLT
jgi:hypothetical protein